MKFAIFAGQDGRPIYINPKMVSYVTEVNEKLTDVSFGPKHAVTIPLPVALVAEDIEKASRA
jgi:hypothetical protein